MRIEITLWWHADTVEVKRLDEVDRFTVGMRPDDDLFVPLVVAEGASHTLLARGPDGRVWLWPLDAPPRPITPDTDVELVIGAFTLRVRAAARELGLRVRPASDTRFANISTVTGALMAALVAVLVLAPTPVRAEDDALPVATLRAWMSVRANKPVASPRVRAADEGGAQAPRRAERRPSSTTAEREARRAAAAARAAAAGEAAARAALAAFVPGGVVRAGEGIDAALDRALGAIGARGATADAGQLAVRVGGGGVGVDTLTVGALHLTGRGVATAGVGARGATCDSDFGCKEDHDVVMTVGRTVLLCGRAGEPAACDDGKELIQKVVASHRDQLRYCYERALQASPGLAGKAVIEWAISASGAVTVARATESDLPREVSGCLVDKVKSWRFPVVPAWGAGVVVRYPFVFRHN